MYIYICIYIYTLVRSRTRQLPQPHYAQVAGITSDKFVPKRYHITDTGGVFA